MLQLPYEKVVEVIVQKSGVSLEEVEKKVAEKCSQLSGLISKEGAAHIIANELGVNITEEFSQIKIGDLNISMRGIEVDGKVLQKYEVREFNSARGPGKVASFFIGDSTGKTRVTTWHDKTDLLSKFNQGDIVRVKDVYVRENNGNLELHLGKDSDIEVNPAGVAIEVGSQAPATERPAAERKIIKDLTDADQNIELFATIVQVYDPRFYAVCPTCNKKANPAGDRFSCAQHGQITPAYSYVMNAVVDDGTETIRTVFFRNQMNNLTKKSQDQILAYKENPAGFEEVKNELLGEQVKVIGRCSRNQMFDRLEFVAQIVNRDVDVGEEIERVKKSMDEEKPSSLPSVEDL